MLAEIDEKSATGETARIFDDVRRLWGVPYVSAIHRHLAARPGVLEWAWDAVAPAFESGCAQEAGWRCSDGIGVTPLDRISREALAVWGVNDASREAAKAVAASFARVAPVNMMFAGLVKALLEGKAPGGAQAAPAAWAPPAPLPVPPAMLAADALPAPQRAVMLRFSTLSDGKPFVPGLYRMLAHWPGLLAHLATVLAPRLESAAGIAACDAIRARIDAAVPGVLATLPGRVLTHDMPDAAERQHFLAVGGTYRKTSPELIVAGRLIEDALS